MENDPCFILIWYESCNNTCNNNKDIGGLAPPVVPKVLNELLDNVLNLHAVKIICSDLSVYYSAAYCCIAVET